MSQDEYIAILFTDCGFTAAKQRKNFIFHRFGRNYSDELTVDERGKLIAALISIKGGPYLSEADLERS